MKITDLLIALCTVLLFACPGNKKSFDEIHRGDIPVSLAIDSLNDINGYYTMRVCKNPKEAKGVEIIAYEPCPTKDSLSRWNHLTYFIFYRKDGMVQYHSLRPKDYHSQPNEGEPAPELSGWYKVKPNHDPTLNGYWLELELYKGRAKPKDRNKDPRFICEMFMDTVKNEIKLKKITSQKVPFNRIFIIDSIFGNESTFNYCFERAVLK